MTRFSAIYLDEEPIVEYLRKYGHGPNSKDYELMISIWIKRLFEKNTNKEYCLAFELDGNLEKINPRFDSSNLNHIKDVIENHRVEKTPCDFILVQGTTDKKSKNCWGFQLKRFGISIKQNFQEELINFINKILKNYQPGEVGLIIIPEADKNLIPKEISKLQTDGLLSEEISKQLKINNKSYKNIYFLSKLMSEIRLIEVWPKQRILCKLNLH